MRATTGPYERKDFVQYSIIWSLNGHRISLSTHLLLLSVWCLGCGGPAPLTVDMPLHLEEHLDDATIVGSEVPEDIPESEDIPEPGRVVLRWATAGLAAGGTDRGEWYLEYIGQSWGSGEQLAERMSLLVDSERNLWVEEFLVLEEEAVL